MNSALTSLCREINDWHPSKHLIPINMIPIMGWVRCVPETQPEQISFLRLGVLFDGGVIDPCKGVAIRKNKESLAVALKLNLMHFWILPRQQDLYTEQTWDTFTVEWEFIVIPIKQLYRVTRNLSLFRLSFSAPDQTESTDLIPLRSEL